MNCRIISFLLIIVSLFSICPVCLAADGGGSLVQYAEGVNLTGAEAECLTVEGSQSNGSVTLGETMCICGTVVITGIHSKGENQLITMLVKNESDGTIYAMGEAESSKNGKFVFDFGLRNEAHGKKLVAYIDGDDGGLQSELEFVYECRCETNRNVLGQMISDVEELVSQCEENGISVEYEKVMLGVMKKFDLFLDDYIKKGLFEEYEHNFKVIQNLGVESMTSLEAYLDGTKAPKIAPIYVSSDITERGQSLFADVSINGEIVNQPVFFNGYGHWADAVSDYESFADLGVNYTHYEIGPDSILKKGTEGRKYDINVTGVNKVKEVFALAEENNISVMFMTSMHYFPDFIYETYPEINNSANQRFPDYMPYNPTHPEVKEALLAFLGAIIPEIKDYKSFHSVCLANEPLFISHEYPDYYLPAYRSFLKKKYKTNDALKAAYGTFFYQTLDTVTMPSKSYNIGNNAYYNDWREFNDSILTEWFEFLSGAVKAIDESIPVHTKVSAYISSAESGSGDRRVYCGTNYEQWSQFMDLNGCDAWGIYENRAGTIQGKTMWYDFMTSLKNAPVINSEDHILVDSSNLVYSADELKFNMADMWQGAIHGRAGSVYWLWDKSSRAAEGTGYYNANLTRRADHVAAIGKVNLDLNRLANEITAIQQKDARCAVLYSNYTQVSQSGKHLAAMYEVYRYLQNKGEKVYVVNDTYPEKLNENKNLELLIVPYGQYMPEKVWVEIEKFIESGKKVIFAEQSNLSYYNENGKSLGSTIKTHVLNNSVRAAFGSWSSSSGSFTSSSEVCAAIENVISGFERDVTVVSGNGLVEWTAAEYGDAYVVNLCNMGNADTSINVSCDFGDEIFDLIENEGITDSFILEPYETKLVRITKIKEGMSFCNQDGNEVETVKSGKITSVANVNMTANSSFVHIVAVYSKDKVLQRTAMETGVSDGKGRAFSECYVEISNAEADNCVVKAFLLDGSGNLKPLVQEEVLGEN